MPNLVPNTAPRDLKTVVEETLGVVLNVRQFGAVSDLVELHDLSITAGSIVAHSASAEWSNEDVGKLIGINGAGTQIGTSTTIPLSSTIARVTDAHTVELSTAAGRTVAGVDGHYGTDSAPAFQRAMNTATVLGRAQVIIPAGRFLLGGPVYVQSNTHVCGQGGRARVSVLKRHHGAYWDVFVAGYPHPGVNHPRYESGGTTYMWWYGGSAYRESATGESISFSGIYVDGNGANAGQLPHEAVGPNGEGSYRGSGFWIQWVNRVSMSDVWADGVSNDGAFIAACRRVSVSRCGFTNFLVRPGGSDTRNGITIAGTQSAIDGSGMDMLSVSDCICHAEDLGIAIQARSPQAANTHFGGTIHVSGNFTHGCGYYGIAVEGYSDPLIGTPVESVTITGNTSEGDAYKASWAAAIALTYECQDAHISGNIVRNAGARAFKISGRETIHLNDNIIDGWNKMDFPGLVSGVFIYKESTNPYNLRKLVISGLTIAGDRTLTQSNIGLLVSGADDLHISHCRVYDTVSTDNAYLSGCGFSLDAVVSLVADHLFCQGIAGDGIIAAAGKVAKLSHCDVMSYAMKSKPGGGASAIAVAGTPQHAEIDTCYLAGGGGRTPYTIPLRVDGPSAVTVNRCRVAGATCVTGGVQGTGLLIYSAAATISDCDVSDCDGAGAFLDGSVLQMRVIQNSFYNNGRSAASPMRIGLNVGPNGADPVRHGLILGNHCYDSQGAPTQQEGIHTPTQSNGFIDIVGNSAWGNAIAPFNGGYVGSSECEVGNSWNRSSGDQATQVGYGGLKFRYGPFDISGPGAPTIAGTTGSIWRQKDASAGHSGLWAYTGDGWLEVPVGVLTGKSLTISDLHPFFKLIKSGALKVEITEDGNLTVKGFTDLQSSLKVTSSSAAHPLVVNNAGGAEILRLGNDAWLTVSKVAVQSQLNLYPLAPGPAYIDLSGNLRSGPVDLASSDVMNRLPAARGGAEGVSGTWQVRMADGTTRTFGIVNGSITYINTP